MSNDHNEPQPQHEGEKKVSPLEQQQPQRPQKCYRSCNTDWYTNISVEPTMFLYMFAFMITSVVEQAFFVNKACLVNNNFTADICDNLNEYPEIKKQVQITTATFHQWENISAHIVPIILALFLGSWSDRRGRKVPLLMGLSGKFIYSCMMVVNASQKSWPVEYIIYTATIPSALTGADVAIFASCFAYISDISTVKNRTTRVTILDVCYLSAMPTGVALGSYLYNNVMGKSYANMFAINASLLFISIIYSLIALKWQTTPKQRSLREVCFCGVFGDFFDIKHVIATFRVLTRKREMHRRIFLSMLLITMGLYTFQRDEKPFLYLYTQFKFDWDVTTYSNFKTFQSSAYVIAMLSGVPLMSKVFKWKDTTIILIGATAHAIARLFFFFADTELMFYMGAVVCSFGPIVGPVLRSITSKIVPQSERGKVFALLSVFDNAIPFISGVCYAQVYKATVGEYGGVFLLTIGTQIGVFILILSIHVINGAGSMVAEEVPEKEVNPICDQVDSGSQKSA
ncbi:SLC46A3 family protein [Megaselia abdita]